MANDFLTMLMEDAIDNSWSPEADSKAIEEDIITPLSVPKFRHHSVPERRKWDAKAKAYTMPKCGLRPTEVRALQRKGVDIFICSEKEENQDRHQARAYNASCREDHRRERYPMKTVLAGLDEFELERVGFEDIDLLDDEKLSSNESLNVFEEMTVPSDNPDWILIEEMILDGKLVFTSTGGIFLDSPEAFSFACEHEETILSLLAKLSS